MSNLQEVFETMKARREAAQRELAQVETLFCDSEKCVDALKGLEPTRRCKRTVEHALVDCTIEEILPSMERTKESYEVRLKKLAALNKDIEKEISEWQVRNKVKVMSG